LICPGDIILDIGANSGQYSLLGSFFTGEKGWVYAFEPAPHKYKELVNHVELNQLENVSCLPYALSNRKGKAYFNLQQDANDGMHHLVTTTDSGQQFIEVETYTLNECLNSIVSKTPIDLIKIDVEGWEEAVFQGGSDIFVQAKPPTIFFESIEEHANRFGFSAKRVQHLLKKHGYQLFSKKHYSSEWAPLSSETEQINLIAIHPSRADLIKAL
jgi:FkbM family methyltransferase